VFTIVLIEMTLRDAALHLVSNPGHLLLRQWNWKSAVFSSIIRAGIFFAVNLTAGWRAATGAMLAEFTYRAVTAGFYGAITQAFREVEPEWAAAMTVMFAVPALSHSLELAVHLLRGTPNLLASLAASVVFTMISTQFNLYAMRRGALIVGTGAHSAAKDLRRMPFLIGGFLSFWFLTLFSRAHKLGMRNSETLPEYSSDTTA
jgi:hypothetical protein